MSSCTLFWDDITKLWDENLLSFTFLTGKLRKNLFRTNNKFSSQNNVPEQRTARHEQVLYLFSLPLTKQVETNLCIIDNLYQSGVQLRIIQKCQPNY